MVADTLSMRDLRRWLVWRSEVRDGKPTKIPYSPTTGQRASSTTPETWTTYLEAVRACKEQGYGGIGFVFTPEDDLCGVDLDGCLDPDTGEIEPWASKIIEELDSYTEISPSGTGVHILVRATLLEGRNRKGRFEAYDRGRYFTVTGKHLAGTPQTIEGRQEELQGVVRRVFGEPDVRGIGGRDMAEDEIRAERIEAEVKVSTRRIELVDDEGNLKLVLDGGEASGDEDSALIVYGPDGPRSAAGIKVHPESGVPSLWLTTAGGGMIMLTFHGGVGLVNIRNEDGTEGTFAVPQE